MATSDDTDEFLTPFPDDDPHTRDTVTVEFCPPFPPTSANPQWAFDPRWRTETVLLLARGIDADAAFDRLPILADALEEAGCDHTALLHHCRTCPHPFDCCWVVNVVLDRVPGELPTSVDPQLLRRGNEPPVRGRPIFHGQQPATRIEPTAIRVVLFLICAIMLLVWLNWRPEPRDHFPTAPALSDSTPSSELTPSQKKLLMDSIMGPGRVGNGRVVREGDPGWDVVKRLAPPPATTP